MKKLRYLVVGIAMSLSLLILPGYQLDVCSNLPGIQSEMPKGYHLVEDPSGELICVPREHGNG